MTPEREAELRRFAHMHRGTAELLAALDAARSREARTREAVFTLISADLRANLEALDRKRAMP